MLPSPKLPVASDPTVSATKHLGQGVVRVGKVVSLIGTAQQCCHHPSTVTFGFVVCTNNPTEATRFLVNRDICFWAGEPFIFAQQMLVRKGCSVALGLIFMACLVGYCERKSNSMCSKAFLWSYSSRLCSLQTFSRCLACEFTPQLFL